MRIRGARRVRLFAVQSALRVPSRGGARTLLHARGDARRAGARHPAARQRRCRVRGRRRECRQRECDNDCAGTRKRARRARAHDERNPVGAGDAERGAQPRDQRCKQPREKSEQHSAAASERAERPRHGRPPARERRDAGLRTVAGRESSDADGIRRQHDRECAADLAAGGAELEQLQRRQADEVKL